MLYMALNCELIEDTSVVMRGGGDVCAGSGVIDRGRHNSLRQVLQHVNTSLQLSGHGDDDHGGRGGSGAHHAGARAHLARDETDEEGAAYVLDDVRGVVPVPGVGPMTVELLTMTVLLVLVVELSEVEMTRDSLVEV